MNCPPIAITVPVCQSLLDEALEEQDVPDGTKDFVVWIYPDKIVGTKENAGIVRKLLAWE